tara:strand:+ start:8539 stop:8646 length:108 start_codon:yes stop_codon:yes gene_type:complete
VNLANTAAAKAYMLSKSKRGVLTPYKALAAANNKA